MDIARVACAPCAIRAAAAATRFVAVVVVGARAACHGKLVKRCRCVCVRLPPPPPTNPYIENRQQCAQHCRRRRQNRQANTQTHIQTCVRLPTYTHAHTHLQCGAAGSSRQRGGQTSYLLRCKKTCLFKQQSCTKNTCASLAHTHARTQQQQQQPQQQRAAVRA